jgi:hypothetical protein
MALEDVRKSCANTVKAKLRRAWMSIPSDHLLCWSMARYQSETQALDDHFASAILRPLNHLVPMASGQDDYVCNRSQVINKSGRFANIDRRRSH